MFDKQKIKSYIIEYQDFVSQVSVFDRKVKIEVSANYIFTGCRRAGKTYTLYQIIQNLLKNGRTKDEILYINFEDERLLELQLADLQRVLEAYFELFPHKPILFLDEIQNIEGWEKFVRRLADTDYQIFVTGSNANMLSKEMATTLGGRFWVKEIFPLSFQEYLQFTGITYEPRDLFSPKSYELKRAFDTFFTQGGFPESSKFQHSREYVSNIYKKVLYGDIIARYGIRNGYSLELLVKKLAESIGDESSNTRIRNLLKAADAQIAINTLIDYTQYCEDAYLISKVSNYLAKFAEREAKKKYYFIDNGVLGLFLQRGKSQLFENYVFTHLQKTERSPIFYLRDGKEVDFYVEEKKELIQVAYSMEHPDTRKRELSSITYFQEKVDAQSALIITYDEEETLKLDGLSVQIIPAWKWALQEF